MRRSRPWLASLTLAVLLLTEGASLPSGATARTKDRSAHDAAATSSTVVGCSTKELTVSVTAGLPGMGEVSSVLLVRNIGSTACHLTGYPTILLQNSMGQEAKAVPTPHGVAGGLPAGAPIPLLVLRRGDVASAVIEGFDVPSGATTICPSYSDFTVTLPGQPASVTLHRQMDICSALNVYPFVMGFNGSYPTGEVSGTAPKCRSTAYGVEVSAFSAADLVAEIGMFPGRSAGRPYQLVLKPGRYQIRSGHDPSSRNVEVHAGQIVHLGRFGACVTTRINSVAPNPPVPTTSVPASG